MAEETTKQVIEDDPIEVRKAKRAALIEAGENPYGHAFHYTHHLTDLDGMMELTPVSYTHLTLPTICSV